MWVISIELLSFCLQLLSLICTRLVLSYLHSMPLAQGRLLDTLLRFCLEFFPTAGVWMSQRLPLLYLKATSSGRSPTPVRIPTPTLQLFLHLYPSLKAQASPVSFSQCPLCPRECLTRWDLNVYRADGRKEGWLEMLGRRKDMGQVLRICFRDLFLIQ